MDSDHNGAMHFDRNVVRVRDYYPPHAYHLPSIAEMEDTLSVIEMRRGQIASLDLAIDAEQRRESSDLIKVQDGYEPRLREVQSRIHELTKELANVETQREFAMNLIREDSRLSIAVLEKQRDEISQVLGVHQGFIAPIRRLPSELLSEIFKYVETMQSPWSITKVSRSWRYVAFRTPQLWTNIQIIFTLDLHPQYLYPSTHYVQRCYTVQGFKKALLLTGNIPLSISFASHMPILSSINSMQESQEMLEALNGQLHRCKTLTFQIDQYLNAATGDMIDVLTASLPLLEDITLICVTPSPLMNQLMRLIGRLAPKLTKLTISFSVSSVSYHHWDPLTFRNIRSLSIRGNLPDVDAKVWSSFSNLQEIEATGSNFQHWPVNHRHLLSLKLVNASGWTFISPERFPMLQTLHLQNAASSSRVFATPNLHTLILSETKPLTMTGFTAPSPVRFEISTGKTKAPVSNRILQSAWFDGLAGIKLLALDVHASDGVILKFLEKMTQLEKLSISCSSSSSMRKRVFKALSTKPKRNGALLCPNLREIVCFPQGGLFPFTPMELVELNPYIAELQEARPDIICSIVDHRPIGGRDYDT